MAFFLSFFYTLLRPAAAAAAVVGEELLLSAAQCFFYSEEAFVVVDGFDDEPIGQRVMVPLFPHSAPLQSFFVAAAAVVDAESKGAEGDL